MKDFTQYGRETMIRVNVPGTSGFYRLRCEAFFTVSKADFKKMVKALQADAETAADNADTLFNFAHYMRDSHIDNAFFEKNAERIAVINSILNPENKCFQVSKDEEKAYKAFKACAADKKTYRPVLFQPFEFNNHIYCTDSFIAARYDRKIESFYDSYITENQEYNAAGDYLGTARPNMEKIFSDFEENRNNYFPVSIPDLKTLKTWAKGKKNETPAVFKYAMETYNYIFQVQHLYKAAALTLSDTLYITDGERPAYMTGNGYTVVIVNMKVSDAAYNAAYEKAPEKALIKVYTDYYGNNAFQVLPLAHDKKENTVSRETEETKENNISSVPAGKEFSNNETDADIINNVSDASDAFQEEKTENNAAADPEKLYKIAGVELEKKRIEEVINNNDYLVKSRTVYRIERTRRGYIAINVYQKKTGVPIIGGACRFTIMNRDRLERMFPDFTEKEFKPVPAADPGKLETMPETVPGNNDNVRQVETAENRTEGNAGISYKASGKTSVNDAKTGITEGIKKDTYSRQAENAIPAGIEKMSNCTKSTVYTIITNYRNMPTLPAMHRNDNMHNPHKLHNRMGTRFPSALSALEKIPFCDGKIAFCDIPSGVPPGPPGMRVSASWNHPSGIIQ